MTIPVIDQEAAAVSYVRRYCKWHVTPVIDSDTVVLDGPGGDLLVLPTLRLIDLVEVIEDDVVLDLTTLRWSSRGLVRKKDGCFWTPEFSGLQVTYSHGFADAPDWWSAVKSYQDRSSSGMAAGGPREAVGPFVFGAVEMSDDGSAFTAAERAILDLYRLEPAQ